MVEGKGKACQRGRAQWSACAGTMNKKEENLGLALLDN
jgi:hypothetical protein